MKLYMVERAEGAADGGNDCGLSDKGRADAQALARTLKRAGADTEVHHAIDLRSEETAAILAKELTWDGRYARRASITPQSEVADFLDEIHSREADLLFVGALPFLARAVNSLLTGKTEPAIVAYEPGGAICLQLRASMMPGSSRIRKRWTMAWMIVPEVLEHAE